MKLSIGEAAHLTEVSVRTLHYYDEIGILKPSEISESGYRYYDDAAVQRLLQILFFREIEVPLKEIPAILDSPDYDRKETLKKHRELLLLKRNHIDELISLADSAIGGNKDMKKSNHSAEELNKAREKYAAEVKERWGNTKEYDESEKRETKRTDEQRVVIANEADEIFKDFAKCMDKSPSDKDVQELVERWRKHITENYYDCTVTILGSLGAMYTADERFRENLDKFGDGNAQFMSDAIKYYCENQ